jgi:hypothetical protein
MLPIISMNKIMISLFSGRYITRGLGIFLTFCYSNYTNCQIVNVERWRYHEDSIGWKGDARVGLLMQKDNNSFMSFHLGTHTQYDDKNNRYLLIGNIDLLNAGNKYFANNGLVHIRYNRVLNQRWRWELFGQAQYNPVRKQQLRALLGTGPRLQWLRTKKCQGFMGVLYMFDYEEEQTSVPLQIIYRREHRISSYISGTFRVGPTTEITSTTYYQPLLSNFGDWRLSTQNKITFRISKHLKFSTLFVLNYDSYPPIDIPAIAYSWDNGIEFEF